MHTFYRLGGRAQRPRTFSRSSARRRRRRISKAMLSHCDHANEGSIPEASWLFFLFKNSAAVWPTSMPVRVEKLAVFLLIGQMQK